jgi:hypothetical protein
MSKHDFDGDKDCEYKYSQKQLLFELVQVTYQVLRIVKRMADPAVSSVSVQQTGDPMLPFAPGNTPGFTATLTPAIESPQTADVVWTSSDTTNFPVTKNPFDATGLTASAAIPETATIGATGTLTCEYLNADGTTATSTPFPWTIVAEDVTAVSIAQTT